MASSVDHNGKFSQLQYSRQRQSFSAHRAALMTKNDLAFPAFYLRTVPTKYKGLCARLGPGGKSRSLQGLLESRKKTGGSHVFFRDN